MGQYERAAKIAGFLRTRVAEIPDTAVVLGSGLGAFGQAMEKEVVIPYREIPDFPIPTVAGHEGNMIFGKIGDKRLIAMQGRFHRYEGYSWEDVTLYLRVFALLGVRNLILTNAVGAINTNYRPGDLMVISDHIGLFCNSPLFGENDERFGPRFPSMCRAYDRDLIAMAHRAAKRCGIALQEGIYCYAKGPMYETPAEIRAMRILGADVCGMSTVPETVVAVHSGLRVLGISCITNMAGGSSTETVTHEEVKATADRVADDFKRLVTESIFGMKKYTD